MAVPGPHSPVDEVSLGVMGTLGSGCSEMSGCFLVQGPRMGCSCTRNLCMRKPGILVMALAVSSAAPPILALLSIPMEFKMVSS